MLPLTREYALAELRAQPDFKQEARERWVTWYLNFAKEHGGDDWKEWHIQYDHIEEEWDNLRAVFDWCAAHDRYDDIRAFWREDRVNEFANIYGYWDDRLIWLDWLIQAAERRGEWSVAVSAMSGKVWTLATMAKSKHLEDADRLLNRAWSLHDHAERKVQVDLAHNIAVLRVRHQQYTDAIQWLDRSEAMLANPYATERERMRQRIALQYWRAIIRYDHKDYDQAELLFQQMLEYGQVIGWERAVVYAQNWLADIAIVRGNLDEAEHLLSAGLPVVERNKDRRRTAFYKRSFARLEQARRKLAEARRWATEALDGFDRLGMQPEAEEMRQLMASVDATLG